jgi:predicted regulator of Ras-like GTPase activity (Roadblock/LC7/MglB family)
MTQSPAPGEMNWVLDSFVARVDHVHQAVILSRDGITLGSSQGLSREDAEHLSALASGVQSLAGGASRHFHRGEVQQTIIQMQSALLFITAVGTGSCLAVLASADADAGLVAYEMAVLVKRVGPHLVANPRFAQQEPVAG